MSHPWARWTADVDWYASLGLQRNPFTAEQEPGVADALWLGTNIAPPSRGDVLQIMGPRGAGKTSQLLRWQRSLGGEYRHVPPGRVGWWPLPHRGSVYWDEADRVPRALLAYLSRRQARSSDILVVGTHVDLSTWLSGARPVRTVTLGTISPNAVVRWAALRIAAAALPGAAGPSLAPLEAEHIADASAGSWRVVGDELHKWAAKLAASPNLSTRR